jgi:hypothetical protein
VQVHIVEAQLLDSDSISVTRTVATTKMPGFTNADMHFVYYFYDVNYLAARGERSIQGFCGKTRRKETSRKSKA